MVKNLGKRALATGLLLTTLATNLSAKPGDNDFGRESDFNHPKTTMVWNDFNVVTEFDYVSQRPDSENGKALGGVTHTYEVLRNGNELAVREKGKDVLVGTMNYWDIDQNKKRGDVEKDARDNGYLTDFTPDFTDALYSALLGAHDSSIENEREKNKQPKSLEKTVSNNYPNTSLIFGGFVGNDSKRGPFVGIEGGVGVDFSKYFGINVLGRFALGEDGKMLRPPITTAESASGIYGHGTEVQEGYNMPGLALDLKVGAKGFYGSIGAGLIFENSNDKTTEVIMRGEDVLASNETYSQDSKISPELRLGIGCVGDSFGVGINYSNNFKGRQSGSLNVIIPIGKTKQEKELLRK